MQRKPNPRALAAGFLLVSAALSVVLLGVRNLYDDEILSLDLVTSPVAKILRVSAEGDVHPPGMYLLAHAAYCIVPSFRWMNLLPGLLVYAGLSMFLLQVTPLFARTRSQICLLLLATVHPQLLMWGGTFRWYGWWTGLALIALTVALQPSDRRPTLGVARALSLGMLLACLFYINYITFLFAFALGVAMLLRYRAQPGKRLMVCGVLAVGVFFALIAPQFHTMLTVHVPIGQAQRYRVAVSFLRLLQSVSASEAYLPWHPLAILAGLLSGVLCVAGVVALVRLWRWTVLHGGRTQPGQVVAMSQSAPAPDVETAQAAVRDGALASIVLFGLLFFLLVAASGLGGKPRNGLLLIPALAPAVALIVGTLRARAQDGILIFLVIWTGVGVAHLVGRHGLTKAFMNDRPEQVVAFIEKTSGAGCAVVITYDSGLAFSLAQANLPRVLVVSPFRSLIFGGSRSLASGCTETRLYAVQSYLGESVARVHALNDELQSSMQFMQGPVRADWFSFDPDAGRKRSLSRLRGVGGDLASVARLPDYRYVVMSSAMDGTKVTSLRRAMPHFLSGYKVSVDEEPLRP